MRHLQRLRHWREGPIWCRDWLIGLVNDFVAWWLRRNAERVNAGDDRPR